MNARLSVVVETSPDIHICGFCKQQYNNFELFVSHKQTGCSVHASDTSSTTTTVSTTAALTGTKTEHINSNPECVFEETFQQVCSPRSVKKILTRAQKTPSKKLKPALTSKRHTCCFSGCTFKTQYGQKDMERHLKTHTGEKPFECELCHKRFSRRDKLNVHSRLHTGEKPHKCKHCAYAAADSSSLKKHLRIHYDERPFKCQICPYASRNSSQLTVHLRSHTGDAPFQCQQCDAKFKINSDLKRHVRIHSGEKPYQCEFCEYRCAMKGNLKSHVHIKHGTEHSFQCALCHFTCTNRTALRQHAREHRPAQPLRCPTCSYSCSSRAALRVHVGVHSEERPFSCDLCGFASKQRSNLLIHRKKCHAEKPEKSGGGDVASAHKPMSTRYRARLDAARAFCCDLCDASFVREDSLRSHRKQHSHTQEVVQLQLCDALTVVPVSVAAKVPVRPESMSPYSTAQLEIIVSQSMGQEDSLITPGEDTEIKSNMILLSPENQDMVVDSLIQHVNILTPMQNADQDLILTQISSEDPNNPLHQALLQTQIPNTSASISTSTSSHTQTFITSCSELDGLNALIQEGGTEVTVVTTGSSSTLVTTATPPDTPFLLIFTIFLQPNQTFHIFTYFHHFFLSYFCSF
uniref:C2H2-type domain-containing protein n=1 Tax=Gouania willdenowi TaxID=441366 RepID=A0A8C5HPD9_GOUWI